MAEPFSKQIGCKGQVDEFDGDLLLELTVGAMCQVDGAHPATPKQAAKLVGPHPLATGLIVRASLRPHPAGCVLLFFRLAGIKQRAHLGCELSVLVALCLDQILPRFIGSCESLVKDRLNPQKSFRSLVHLSENPVCGL